MSRAGRTLVRSRPFTADTVITGVSDTVVSSELVGMATHAIDKGFIQLLADPRSDLRVLVVYGPDGRTFRRATIGVSLGLLDFEPVATHVLALRRTDTLELVTYSLHRSGR